MRFVETLFNGAFVIELEKKADERGFFARSFCRQEFQAHGLTPDVVQCNLSFNDVAGTVRGMHWQEAPATETKLVSCIRGKILDVIVDMRRESPTYLRHFRIELAANDYQSLYVPELFAHGYQTLTANAEVLYLVSGYHARECEAGVRHDDPALGIDWPLPVTRISDKDAAWPLVSVGRGADS